MLVPLSSLLQLTLSLGVYAFVLLGFADAVYVLFNNSPSVIDGSVTPVSYLEILENMVLWVLGNC
ncbi:hypothetical protein T492DRAFT_897446 [Pavlovales sp. CCMP2436]|nr:hypothetical protein T492DRAFT_897446 [Pavlovales sp. CCMP2436]